MDLTGSGQTELSLRGLEPDYLGGINSLTGERVMKSKSEILGSRALFILLALQLVGCGKDATSALESIPVDETVQISGLSAEVRVYRSELNVPHIFAKNPLDRYRVMGFIMAKDRYAQIDLGRRVGQGRVAELVGSFGEEIDRQTRNRGLAEVSRRLWNAMSQERKAEFDAFASGINDYIEAVQAGTYEAPEEFDILRGLVGVSKPETLMEPITGEDLMGMTAVVVSRLGFEDSEIAVTETLQSLETLFEGLPNASELYPAFMDAIWNDITPYHKLSEAPGFGLNGAAGEPNAPTMNSEKLGTSQLRPKALSLPASLQARATRAGSRFNQWVTRRGKEVYGSNAWAVSSAGTEGGGAILAGDGHLELSVPSLFYQMCVDDSYFGNDDFKTCGLFFPGLPYMAVGTNGHVAWSQTYLYADITDWYREQIQLDDEGKPSASLFQGQWKPLSTHEETFKTRKSDGSFTESTFTFYTTFDGRRLLNIEGTESSRVGPATVSMDGLLIDPADTDDDGIIYGISFDWTAFDIASTLDAVAGFSEAKSVEEFRQATKGLVAYAQNVLVADKHGDILFTPYNAMPCRDHLTVENGRWVEGADPQYLIDGTRFGGFTIPLDADGMPDESFQDDPQRCVIPFEDMPQAKSPESGFVMSANHDIAGTSFDGNLANDLHYLGGFWYPAFRAHTIHTHLEALVQTQSANLKTMADVQGNHDSTMGQLLTPHLIQAIERAQLISAESTDPVEVSLRSTYAGASSQFDQALAYFETWLSADAPASSGVETFYQSVTAQERDYSVATTLFNVWYRRMLEKTFADERLEFLWKGNDTRRLGRILPRMLANRNAAESAQRADYVRERGESIFFDDLRTEAIEHSDELILTTLSEVFTELSQRQSGTGQGGYGTDDMSMWLWGMRHQVLFKSLLGSVAEDNPIVGLIGLTFSITTDNLPLLGEDGNEDDPRSEFINFPRNGDYYAVDSAGAPLDANHFFYSHGPVMRMVFHLTPERITGQNIVPGGQSANTKDPHFADQAALWLGNQTVPVRYHVEDLLEGIESSERYVAKE